MALALRVPSPQMQAIYTEAYWLWHSKATWTALHDLSLASLSLLYYANTVKAASAWEAYSSHTH